MPFFTRILPVFAILTLINLSACQTIKPTLQSHNTVVNLDEDRDSDNDGVPDSKDQCPNTPLNVVVDERGCPVPMDMTADAIPESRFFFFKNQSYPYWINGSKETSYDNMRQNMVKDFQHMREFFGRASNDPICVEIEGHASKGRYGDTIKDIDLQRALTIKQMYKEWLGFEEKNIKISPYGTVRNIATNETPEGAEMNQRVYTRWVRCPITK